MRPIACVLLLCGVAAAQSEPQLTAVDPGPPPSDAVTSEGKPIGCTIENAAMACKTGAGNIYSKSAFYSAQIHLKFSIPNMPDEQSQTRGNSGVYLQGRYEIQILDSYQNPTYPTGALGALYGQSAPLVNAARAPETWQSYDIIFNAPRCKGVAVADPGSVTGLLNGVLVQNHTMIRHEPGACLSKKTKFESKMESHAVLSINKYNTYREQC